MTSPVNSATAAARQASNPNDEIRRLMLPYFYDRNDSATSMRGKKGAWVRISDVKRELKGAHGLTQQQVVANLNYLIDRGWVEVDAVTKDVRPRGGSMTVPSTTEYYKITAKGIDRIEGGSEFEPRDPYPGINVQATGQNVITLGDGNLVNAEFNELRMELEELKEKLIASDELTDSEKLDLAVDVQTISDQLAKAKPDPEVTRALWSRLEKAASVAGLAELALNVGYLLGPIIG